MMDLVFLQSFLLGLLGATLTLYLAKQVVIPELRPLYDTSQIESDLRDLRAAVVDDRQRIRAVQTEIEAQPQRVADLARLVESYEGLLKLDQSSLDALEGRLRRNQIFSRGMGFLLFVILGGVIAGLLTGRVTVSGFQGTLPQSFQAVAIGAGWTGFLSVLGIRNIQEAAANQLDQVRDHAVQQIDALKTDLDAMVRPGPGQGPTMVPFSAQPALATKMSERIDETLREISARINAGQVRLREDARRVI
jgi:hypothetical protein